MEDWDGGQRWMLLFATRRHDEGVKAEDTTMCSTALLPDTQLFALRDKCWITLLSPRGHLRRRKSPGQRTSFPPSCLQAHKCVGHSPNKTFSPFAQDLLYLLTSPTAPRPSDIPYCPTSLRRPLLPHVLYCPTSLRRPLLPHVPPTSPTARCPSDVPY